VVLVSTVDVEDLVARCVEGDDGAKALFYTEYTGLVERAIIRKLGQVIGSGSVRSEVEDIRSEVFARLFQNDRSPLRGLKKPGAINAWLMTVAGNHTVDYVRRWSRRERVQTSMAEETGDRYFGSPEDLAIANERRELLEERLDELPAQDRLILELFYVHGLKYAEIAEVISMNINTMSARLRRAKSKLRALLEEDRDAIAWRR